MPLDFLPHSISIRHRDPEPVSLVAVAAIASENDQLNLVRLLERILSASFGLFLFLSFFSLSHWKRLARAREERNAR